MSWVEKTSGGRYRGVYRDPGGDRHSKVFARKAEAKLWLAAADTDQARGLWVDPRGGAVELQDWAQRWFATRTVRPTTSAADHGRYANHLAPAFGAMPLKDLTPMRIRTFVAELSTRRDALCDFAGDSRHANAWAADLYRRARSRGHDHPHAVRILARAWAHIIWRCWLDNTPYDPARHGELQRILNQDQPQVA